MKNLFFEELEAIEELGDVADFAGAAAPWVAIGVGIAVGLVT